MMGSCYSRHVRSQTLLTTATDQTFVHQTTHQHVNRIHEITTDEQLNEIINDQNHRQVLIVCDFYAVWCRPCSQIGQIIQQWASQDYNTDAIFVKINVDHADELSKRFSIDILPTFVFYKNAQEIVRLVGADRIKLKQHIDKYK
jgi:thioredoxin 1